MNELSSAFNEYMNEVENLNSVEKRKELLMNIKELVAIFQTLAENENISLDNFVDNNRINHSIDYNNEDQVLNDSIMYLEIAKNNIGDYLNRSKR